MYVIHNIENNEFSLSLLRHVLADDKLVVFFYYPRKLCLEKIGCKVCYGILFLNCELLTSLQPTTSKITFHQVTT